MIGGMPLAAGFLWKLPARRSLSIDCSTGGNDPYRGVECGNCEGNGDVPG